MNMWNFFNFFFSPLCGLVNTGCPERLWTLHSRTYLRALWTWFWVTSCRWPCLSRSVGQPEAPSHLSHSVVTSSVFWGLAQCNSALQTLLDLEFGGKSHLQSQHSFPVFHGSRVDQITAHLCGWVTCNLLYSREANVGICFWRIAGVSDRG